MPIAQAQYKDDLLAAVSRAKEIIGEEGAATPEGECPSTIISEPDDAEGPNTGFRFFTLNRPIWINVNATEVFKDSGETGIPPVTIDGRKVTCERTVMEHRYSALAMYGPESTDE